MKKKVTRTAIRAEELLAASQARLGDAEELLGRRRWRGSMYLAGLAAECVLKWAFCQRAGRQFYTKQDLWSRRGHDLEALRQQARLEFVGPLGQFSGLFDKVKLWDVNWRYQRHSQDVHTEKEAEQFVTAAKAFCRRIHLQRR